MATSPTPAVAAAALVLGALGPLNGCYAGVLFVEAETDGSAAGADTDAQTDGAGPDGDGADPPPPATCNGQTGVGARPLRRLTPIEYQNTMRDLLGDPDFVAEYDALETTITERGVRQLRNGAEAAVQRSDAWTRTVVPCPLDVADAQCANELIDTFATRAFRRPVTDEERTWLEAVFADGQSGRTPSEAILMLVETILQAPAMIYHQEVGRAVPDAPDEIRALDEYELASRLSYLLWDTLPDDELFEAAVDGSLGSDTGLTEQVDRMLDDPRTQAKVEEMVWSWLRLDGGQQHDALEDAMKDPDLYPDYTPALQDAMRVELEALVGSVFQSADSPFDELLTTRRAYVNRALADLYGVSGPLDDDTWEWVDLDATQRSGLLTRAAFLTVYAGSRVHSPIRRGVSVVEDVLCMELADPPPNVDNVPPEGGSGVDAETVREQVEARTSDAECIGCHSIINPIGFTFEHYDAMGRWQDDEVLSGKPVDSTSQIAISDLQGDFEGALALSDALAQSQAARECLARTWFEHALGGELGELDECQTQQIADNFAQTGDMRSLLREIVLSDSFRYINTAQE